MEAKEEAEKRQSLIDSMSAKDFLIGRTKETVKVPVRGFGGSKEIDMRVRLSKNEMKQHEHILKRWDAGRENQTPLVESEKDEIALANLLENLTGIDSDIWLDSDLAPDIADELLQMYFVIEPTKRLVATQKFLANQLRAELRGHAAGVGKDTP